MVARLVRDQEVVGSSPVASTIGSPHKNYVDVRSVRGVALLVARSVRDAEVVGSNPVASTNYKVKAAGLAGGFDFVISFSLHLYNRASDDGRVKYAPRVPITISVSEKILHGKRLLKKGRAGS